VLLEYISDLSPSTLVVVVFTVHPGELSANVLLALTRIVLEKKAFVHIEFGSYF
jgi:hypothetical protein